jgi:hypothetical protein
VGIRCADHVTPSTRKSRHYFADSGGRSGGIVRLRTKATEFSLVFSLVFELTSVCDDVSGPWTVYTYNLTPLIPIIFITEGGPFC